MTEGSYLSEFFWKVQARPGMYIYNYEIGVLETMLHGWNAHRLLFPDDDAFAEEFFTSFVRFLAEKYNTGAAMGWV